MKLQTFRHIGSVMKLPVSNRVMQTGTSWLLIQYILELWISIWVTYFRLDNTIPYLLFLQDIYAIICCLIITDHNLGLLFFVWEPFIMVVSPYLGIVTYSMVVHLGLHPRINYISSIYFLSSTFLSLYSPATFVFELRLFYITFELLWLTK